MSVEEYYKDMGVVHEDVCWVCAFEEVPGMKRSLARALWAKKYAPWVALAVMLALTYVVAISTMYWIVGGL